MLTDFYEFTMANGYYQKGLGDTIAYFDMFYRNVPDNAGYAIMAGVEQLVEYLSNLRFTQSDLDYLRGKGCFCEEFLDYLAHFEFACDVWCVEEGMPIFPQEPIVTVEGPAIECQLLETLLLVTFNHQCLIATKANRICRAAAGRPVMEFGARRAQGYDAAYFGARASYIGGCGSTSCVMAARDFGIPASGTMAHSWVQMFPTEYDAFKKYAEMYPDNCVLLVDTYNVLRHGVPDAIKVFDEVLKPMGKRPKGVRIDSGDIAYLSKKARKMLDEAGFPDAVIAASNDLDEFLINDLKIQGAAITSWGVGTNLITSKDCPSFGGVYKLAAIQNKDGEFVPKIKISENIEKITNPGNKTIYRIYDKDTGKIRADLICFADETYDTSEDLLLFDPNSTWKKTRLEGGTYTMKEILKPIFIRGECKYTSPPVKEIASFCEQEKNTLWDETKRLFNPHKVYVDLSQRLYDTKTELLNNVNR